MGMPARSRRLSQTLVALLADRVVEREVQGLHRTDPAALVESFLTDTYRDPTFDTEAAPCHFGITCSQVSLPLVVPQKTHAVIRAPKSRSEHTGVRTAWTRRARSSWRALAGEQQLAELLAGGPEANLMPG
jgi:hypothetical protein